MRHVDADYPDYLIDRAKHALVAAQLGTDDQALEQITPQASTGESVDTASDETRELVMLLFGACSAMVATLGDGGATPVKVQVFDEEGAEVSIDQADPPVRTAVRTLLAEVHGNTGAAREQVEIALANAAPDEVNSLVLQALRWTIRLADECLDRELPIAPWIAEAMAE
ncbi:MAG: hypothetical protein ACRDQW_09750 [Haloechinothrix sp.]